MEHGAEAEEHALRETAQHADLADGQRILELGCGWGSLTLWMAEKYRRSRITAVSNSTPQRRFIEGEATRRGLTNVRVVTQDMNQFEPTGRFDRVVSVEMFEHMANWPALLDRIRSWLRPDGRLFLHVFSHKSAPYRFDHGDDADWIARHFFTGGIMPSHGLIRHFDFSFAVEREWRWDGAHYQRTALDWLAKIAADKRWKKIVLVWPPVSVVAQPRPGTTDAERARLRPDAIDAWKTALAAWRTYEQFAAAHTGFPGRAAHAHALASRAEALAAQQ